LVRFGQEARGQQGFEFADADFCLLLDDLQDAFVSGRVERFVFDVFSFVFFEVLERLVRGLFESSLPRGSLRGSCDTRGRFDPLLICLNSLILIRG